MENRMENKTFVSALASCTLIRDLQSYTPATKTRILKTESRTSNVWKMCYKEG